MRKLFTYAAFRIAAIYFIISTLWIIFSDTLVAYLTFDIETLNSLQTLKGWFFVVITSVLLFYLINKQLIKEKKLNENLEKRKYEFERILQEAPHPTIVYNEKGDILLVNKIWLKLTGYSFEEINTIDKWTQKAHKEKAPQIKAMFDALYTQTKNIDNGIMKICTKSNDVLTWHFSTSPFGIKEGKQTMISSAIDITELEAKNHILVQQSKMAAMGEIIENIAHQWRQPLNNISTLSTGIQLKKESSDLSDEYFFDSLQTINHNAQYLSHTIDDFRSFFDRDKIKHTFKIKETLFSTLKLLKYKLNDLDITVLQKLDDTVITNYKNDLIQVLLNLFNNSMDAFQIKDGNQRVILVEVMHDETHCKIEYIDSAGGIKETIIDKIFEPYFTTKHKSQGTGIGLYMVEEIICKRMKGEIAAQNATFTHANEELKGARFSITLPIKYPTTS